MRELYDDGVQEYVLAIETKNEVFELVSDLLMDTMLEAPYRPYGDWNDLIVEHGEHRCTFYVDTAKEFPVFGAYDHNGSVKFGMGCDTCFGDFKSFAYKALGFE